MADDFQAYPGFGQYRRVEAYPMPDGTTRYVGYYEGGGVVLPDYTPPGVAPAVPASTAPDTSALAGRPFALPDVQPGQAGAAEPARTIKVRSPEGHVVSFPEGTSEADINEAMGQLAGSQTVPLDKQVDEKTGAPWNVRASVGAASAPNDRLATLRKFYPDAQPYGDDNFVYTSPRTGRPTLYNEKNAKLFGMVPLPTMGDIASIGPEIAEGIGGMLGGAGAAAFAPATGGASVLAVPTATGAGAATGRAAYEALAQSLGSTVDTRGLAHRLSDTAMTFGVNSVAGPAGELAMRGARSAFGPVNDTAQQMLQRFRDAGVRPVAGAVSGNRGVQTIEHGIANMPGGAARMMNHTQGAIEDVARSAQGLAGRYATGDGAHAAGQVGTAQELGANVIRGAQQAGERFNATRNFLDDMMERSIGGSTPVQVPNVTALGGDLAATLAQAPRARQAALGGPVAQAGQIIQDARGGIPFSALRGIRTDLGRMLDQPDVSGYTPAQMTAMRRLYGALTQDIYEAARQTGPEAEKWLRLHDRYVRLNRNVNMPTLEAVNKVADNADQAYRLVAKWTREGGVELARLRRSLTPEQWDQAAGTLLHRLGTPKGAAAGITELGEDVAEFSARRFLSRFGELTPEARRTIWGGTRYRDLAPALENLMKVSKALEDSASMANRSGTARALGVMTGVLSATQYFMDGSPGKAAATVGATVVAPWALAKVMTSPRFVQWLAFSMRTGSVTGAAARLGAIAEAEPGLRDAINNFYAALQAQGVVQQK